MNEDGPLGLQAMHLALSGALVIQRRQYFPILWSFSPQCYNPRFLT